MISQVLTLAAVIGIAVASGPVIVQPVVYHAPQPYKFGYDVKDKVGQQYREESGNGAGHVQGSYGFTDARGVKRQVDYVADHAGFRAQVKTNEPGTANQNPAAVQMISAAPYQGGVAYNGIGAGLGVAAAVPVGLGIGGIGLGLGGVGLGPHYGYGSYGMLPAYGGYYGLGNSLGGFGYGVPSLGYTRYGY